MTASPTTVFVAGADATARRRRYCRSNLHRYVASIRTMPPADRQAVHAMLDHVGRPARRNTHRTRLQLLRLAASVARLNDPKLAHLHLSIAQCEEHLNGTHP